MGSYLGWPKRRAEWASYPSIPRARRPRLRLLTRLVSKTRNGAQRGSLWLLRGAALLPRLARRVFYELIEIEPPNCVELPVYDRWLVKPTIHRANPSVSAVADWIESVLGATQPG